MKHLCYLGILKEEFSAHSRPVMLISRKITQDKSISLTKDTLSVLGSSRCKVLSVLYLKDAFHSLRLSENSKRYCRILPYFGSTSYLYQRMSIEYLTFNLAILYKCYIRMFIKQEIL